MANTTARVATVTRKPGAESCAHPPGQHFGLAVYRSPSDRIMMMRSWAMPTIDELVEPFTQALSV